MNKKEYFELDLVRCIAAILVLIGHSANYQLVTEYEGINYDLLMLESGIMDTKFHLALLHVVRIIYLFHMPLFFALSGALFKNSLNQNKYLTLGSLMIDKAKHLLIPWFTVTLLFSSPLKYLAGFYHDADLGIDLLQRIFNGQILLKGNSYLWFLPALYIIQLIVYTFEKKFFFHPYGTLLVVILTASFRHCNVGAILYSALDNLVYFYTGFIWIDYRNQFNIWGEKHKYLGWVSLALLLYIYYINNHTGIHPIPLGYLGKLAGILSVYIFCLWMSKKERFKSCPIIKNFTKATMGLYLYAEPVNYLLLKLFIDKFSIFILGSELGAMILFIIRTIGVGFFAYTITFILRKLKIKYLS